MRHDEKQKCETEYCRVQMMNNGWPSGCCGKSAKGKLADGTPACGVHLAGERRREQNANKGAEERRKEREFADEVRALLEPLGISGHATGYRHRQCIVNFDDLLGCMLEHDTTSGYEQWCGDCDNVDNMGKTIDISRCKKCIAREISPTGFLRR